MRGVWSLEPRSRAALDRTAEGGRPHVGIAGGQSSTWAMLEARVLKPKAWGLKPGAEESSCARPDGRGRPSPRGQCWRPEFQVGIAGGQRSEGGSVGPEAWSRGVELRSTGRPRAAVPTWALLEARVPGGQCWRPEFQVGIAGGQSSEAWGLKPELILHKRFREIGKGLTGDDG